MARIRANFIDGEVENNPLAAGGGTLTSASLADLPEVVAPDIAVLVIDPEADLEEVDKPEIAYVTAHASGATTATIQRGREGTIDRSHVAGTRWIHGLVISDLHSDKYSEVIGDGVATEFTIAHNLGSTKLRRLVQTAAPPHEEVTADIEYPNDDEAIVRFGQTVPQAGEFEVTFWL